MFHFYSCHFQRHVLFRQLMMIKRVNQLPVCRQPPKFFFFFGTKLVIIRQLHAIFQLTRPREKQEICIERNPAIFCYHEKSVTTTSILWFLFAIPFASHLIHLYIYFVYPFREHAILHFSIRSGSWLCEKCAHAYQIHRPLMLHVMQYTPRHF